MIPIELSISGLYSYQKTQKIDFRRLLDGQIFGIFGAVGSGKSSILEAITYALYGESERLNNRDNRGYNMMNLKSDELTIDFQFLNFDGKKYRFTVRAKRHGKDFEKVGTAQRQAYVQQNNDWLPLEEVDASKIIGLSYENFRRTIIIPQGKFQEFLQLGDKDRTDMLKEIFNLDKYEFYYQTANLEKKNEEKRQHLEGQLSQFSEVSPESVEKASKQVSLLKKELAALEKQREEKEAIWRVFAQLEKRFAEKAALEKKLSTLQEEDPKIKELEQKVIRFEIAASSFRSQLERKSEYEAEIKEQNKSLAENEANLKEKKQLLSGLQKNWPELEQAYKEMDKKKQELSDLEQLLTIAELQLELKENKERKREAVPHIEKATRSRNEIQQSLNDLKSELKKLKSDTTDIKELLLCRQWLQKRDERLDLAKRKDEITKKCRAQIDDRLEMKQVIIDGKDLPQIETKLTDLHLEVKQEIESLDKKLGGFRLNAKLEEFVQVLESGAPCPLCGAREHPEILDIGDVSDHIDSLENQLAKLDKQLTALNDAIRFVQQERSRISALLEQDEGIQKQLRAIQQETEPTIFSEWKDKTTEELEKVIQDAEKEKVQIKQKEQELEKREQDLKKASDTLEKYTRASEKIERHIDQIDTKISDRVEQLKVLPESRVREGGEFLSIEKEKLKNKIESIHSDYEKTRKQIESVTREIGILEDRIARLRTDITGLSQKLAELEHVIQKQLEESEFESIREIKELGAEDLDTKNARKEIEQHKLQLHSTKESIKAIRAELEGSDFDPEKTTRLKEETEALRSKEKNLQEEYIRSRTALEKMKEDLQKQNELRKELAGIENRAGNIKTLKNLFKGSGFVNYISSVYLHNLCEAANERFYHLTRQQLRLEVNERNAFEVRDFMNNGRLRSVKTLSGGQTFQAALSLALALAESVQEQNQAEQNFFFLDEGFGALDEESLQVVFETLKSLRKEKRIVGVISHVDALQQEIDMFLHIHNDSEKGSLIEVSWEG